MSRFADDIRRHRLVERLDIGGVPYRENRQLIALCRSVIHTALDDHPDDLHQTPVFEVSAVGEMLDNQPIEVDQPSMRPPYDLCWAEYARPHSPAYFGAVYLTTDLDVPPEEPEPVGSVMGDLRNLLDTELAARPPTLPARWQVTAVPAAANRSGRAFTGFGVMAYYLDEHGDAISNGWVAAKGCPMAPDGDGPWFGSFCSIIGRAFSLLNCANVGTAIHRAPPKVQRARARRKAPPMVDYRTLTIGRPGARSGGTTAQSDAEVRLHLRRGHFADYRNGAGLFGRPELRRVFWISPTLVGNVEAGEVRKDYRVEGP